jgi:U2-associated protein SR140
VRCTNNASGETHETGDLYSIKIMWPRTMEERQRGRNTGFVCFMRRDDAEEAMEAYNETDPFNVGRLLMMRWGKNVKKNVRRGTGGLEETPISANGSQRLEIIEQGLIEGQTSTAVTGTTSTKAPAALQDTSVDHLGGKWDDGPSPSVILADSEMQEEMVSKPYDPELHATTAIRIEPLVDKSRFHFVSRVASYVAKDGVDFEKRLVEEEGKNPLFSFLTLENATEQQRIENLFYRWRVYSFSQGDSYWTWRTEPFAMFHPRGRFWIPPPLDEEAAAQDREALAGSEHGQKQLTENRRKREYRTGRQFELARSIRRKGRGQPGENSTRLSAEDVVQFDTLVRNELSISRESICRAMAFCFDKCLAAAEVSNLLKEALLDDSPAIVMDVRIARLYLLSDILFNSQQPGVRNAFMYRSTIESMAPEIFRSLGSYRDKNVGRMTINKLRKAVSTVLGAWTEWGVYNPVFLDELEAHFDGKEFKAEGAEDDSVGGNDKPRAQEEDTYVPESMGDAVVSGPRGDWTAVPTSEIGFDHGQTMLVPSSDESDRDSGLGRRNKQGLCETTVYHTREKSSKKENLARRDASKGLGGENDDGIDGEPVDENGDKIDEEPPETMDGSGVGREDLDGEDIDEENLEEDLDGESVDGTDLDGEEIDDDALDGDVISDDEAPE